MKANFRPFYRALHSRGVNTEILAVRVGTSRSHLCQVLHGHRTGRDKTRADLLAALLPEEIVLWQEALKQA